MNPLSMKFAEILLVEDSPADVLITQAAFEEFKIANTLHVVEDGEEALDFLNCRGEFKDAPRPDLILLDLNLPRKNGREVLADIKKDENLCNIPVVVLTTSQAEQDILQAYNQHANCYIVKPVGFKNFIEAVKSIQNFWFGVVTLPSEVANGGAPGSDITG